MDNILKIFIEHPNKEFHVREIARKIKKSPTTASKCLKEYEKEGLLLSEMKLNHLIFKANTKNTRFKLRKIFENVKKINDSGIVLFLEKEFNFPEFIGLFGSFARGENNENSDIDLFVISSAKNKPSLKKYEEILSHQIHLLVFSRDSIEKMKEKNPELLNKLIRNIDLSGQWRLFK